MSAERFRGRQIADEGGRVHDQHHRFPLGQPGHDLDLRCLQLRRSCDGFYTQRFLHDKKQRFVMQERFKPLLQALCRIRIIFHDDHGLRILIECRRQQ